LFGRNVLLQWDYMNDFERGINPDHRPESADGSSPSNNSVGCAEIIYWCTFGANMCALMIGLTRAYRFLQGQPLPSSEFPAPAADIGAYLLLFVLFAAPLNLVMMLMSSLSLRRRFLTALMLVVSLAALLLPEF
jgi:hypothetical protein